jgi:hypothetical protein
VLAGDEEAADEAAQEREGHGDEVEHKVSLKSNDWRRP